MDLATEQIAEYLFEKTAFTNFQPFKVKSRDEWHNPKGYAKEVGNALINGLIGGAVAGTVGHHLTGNKSIGILSGIAGHTAGVYRSRRKTESDAGIALSTPKQYLARLVPPVIIRYGSDSIHNMVGPGSAKAHAAIATLALGALLGADYTIRDYQKR